MEYTLCEHYLIVCEDQVLAPEGHPSGYSPAIFRPNGSRRW